MQKTLISLAFALGIAASSTAAAAECPSLPQGTGVEWQEAEGTNYKVCRAIDEAGTQLLGVMLTPEPQLKLRRRNRVEEGMVGRHEVHWYRPEIVEPGAAEKRVTVIELDDDRYAQIWLDANDPAQLKRAMHIARLMALY
ncbi:hypothetical protein Psesu_2067 [Pseudoxanthomonas suwonensis 11-1]|uniref:Secreted protein n=1 Tax=Pseudoxanthomonas suwonensis (strain 11-1) TaxID=743721 RepID=E6WUB9_PSEUU|nr:hypothetical protein [Pseudoxanthomonas suwonensis]ADV27903.1 hypothetical protein Psesu_2067 [Pseudoxanthomonas suwonensis 11-1]